METTEYRTTLKQKLVESAAKVVYTYTAHWKIVDRLKYRYCTIKIAQVIFTGIASCGLLSILLGSYPCFSIIGGVFAFLSLSVNLYSLHFNLPDKIKQHTDAANELWLIRESYMALITDFDVMDDEKIRNERDKLTKMINQVNVTYPNTDKQSYTEAQVALKQDEEQTFSEGEAEKLLNLHHKKHSTKT